MKFSLIHFSLPLLALPLIFYSGKSYAHIECPVETFWGSTEDACPHIFHELNQDADVGPVRVPNSQPVYHSIYLRNECHLPIRLALRYKDSDNNWITGGWWNFDSNDAARLSSNGQLIRSDNSIFYYYAEVTANGYNYSWEGDELRQFNGRTLPMREKQLSLDSDGDYILSLGCDNLS